MSIIDYLDRSHLIDHIKKIPTSLISEILIIIFGINIIFAFIYYQIYKYDNSSFKNIHNVDDLHKEKIISFYDFLYYSNTLFFSLGYDIVPQANLAKFLSVVHLNLGFIITAIYISKIISSWN